MVIWIVVGVTFLFVVGAGCWCWLEVTRTLAELSEAFGLSAGDVSLFECSSRISYVAGAFSGEKPDEPTE